MMQTNDNKRNQLEKPSSYESFLADVSFYGGDLNETFITKADLVNKTYSIKWQLANLSTRGRTTDLTRLYNLGLSYKNTHILLMVFKYWAKVMAAGTTESRMGAVCNIIRTYGIKIISDANFLRANYGQLTLSNKKNLNTLFLVLHDIFLYEEYKIQRDWCKDNLPSEKINPHDPVNGAYSDTEFNAYMDKALIDISLRRNAWLTKKNSTEFLNYSAAISRSIALISSRRAAQLCQCKICDVQNYGIDNEDIHIDQKIISILFHRSKINNSGFRSHPEGDVFPFSGIFSQIIVIYLADYKILLKKYCDTFKVDFQQVPWDCYPLFPDISSIKSKKDLISPNIHTDLFHRNLASILNSARKSNFSINRVRHSTITRGMESGLSNPELARLTGVTIPAVRNYKDLTPQSREMINDKFSKKILLEQSFNWTIKEYNEHFNKVYTDELGQNLGGIKNDIGCNTCTKKLGAPLGCYACGANLFVPFIEGDHKSQLTKAQAKKNFLVDTGGNNHQIFEIDMIIKRIKQVITEQKALKKSRSNLNE